MLWTAVVGLVVAGFLFLMFVGLPNRIIFPTDAVSPAGPLPQGAERLAVTTPRGETLHGIHIPPAGSGDGPRTLILGFGGNAWNGQDVAEYLHDLYPEAHVVTFHYRGYRPSTGSASPGALLADAPLVHDAAVERVSPDRTVAVGFSIGSAVAAGLSRSRDVDGMILVTPFDSLKALAQSLYPWLPVGAFITDDLAAADYLARSNVPVAIVAAEYDQIVRPSRTAALRERVANLAYDRTIAGAGHNDIYARSDFHAAMDEALAAVTGG